MKILVIALVLITLYFTYQMTFGRANESYTFCLDQVIEATTDAEALTCGQKRIAYEELAACITAVQESSTIGSLLYGPSGAKDKVTLLLTEHNKLCTESTVKIPGETLYMGK